MEQQSLHDEQQPTVRAMTESLRKAKHGIQLLQALEPERLTLRQRHAIWTMAERIRTASIALVDEIVHDNNAI